MSVDKEIHALLRDEAIILAAGIILDFDISLEEILNECYRQHTEGKVHGGR